jgi:hypothetical protein
MKMGLNIVTQAGEFEPFCKYNGKAGRWYAKQGEQEVEVLNPVFVADFANIRTGWFYFKAGAAPQKVFDVSLQQAAPKPNATYVDDKGVTRDCFKRGFELRLFSKNSFGGVVVLSGASMHLNNAISDLFNTYEAAPEGKQGLLPVVKCTGTTPMKDKQGTNYRPVFVIEKWVSRPAELDAQPVAASQPAPVAASAESEF